LHFLVENTRERYELMFHNQSAEFLLNLFYARERGAEI